MLTLSQKSMMAAFISKLTGRDLLNLCPECHKMHSCGSEHSYLLYDNGKCSLCGKTGRVINCAIANQVIREGIDLVDYWREGKKQA